MEELAGLYLPGLKICAEEDVRELEQEEEQQEEEEEEEQQQFSDPDNSEVYACKDDQEFKEAI